jgi:hypothetical protein
MINVNSSSGFNCRNDVGRDGGDRRRNRRIDSVRLSKSRLRLDPSSFFITLACRLIDR